MCTSSSPTIAIINTYFSDPNDDNNIYEYLVPEYLVSPTWKTCSSSSVCTEAPFTGTCSAVDSSNVKLGVKCPCATSNNYECVGCEFKNNVCVLCGAGKYNDQSDHSSCKNCGVGKFNNLEGQTSCKNCGVGKFNNVEGQSGEAIACKNCSVGKFNNLEGQANCKNCGVGKSNDLEGQSDEAVACKNCSVGKVNNLEGQTILPRRTCRKFSRARMLV